MASAPDSPALDAARTALAGLRTGAQDMEDELLASLAVTGDPHTQRALDGWVDAAVDAARAVAARATEERQRLAQLAPVMAPSPPPGPALPASHARAGAELPAASGRGEPPTHEPAPAAGSPRRATTDSGVPR